MTRFAELHALLTGAPIPAAVENSGQPDATEMPDQIVSPSGRITGCIADDGQEVRRLQQTRLSLIPRQVGMPINRRKLMALTHEQLKREIGRCQT